MQRRDVGQHRVTSGEALGKRVARLEEWMDKVPKIRAKCIRWAGLHLMDRFAE